MYNSHLCAISFINKLICKQIAYNLNNFAAKYMNWLTNIPINELFAEFFCRFLFKKLFLNNKVLK